MQEMGIFGKEWLQKMNTYSLLGYTIEDDSVYEDMMHPSNKVDFSSASFSSLLLTSQNVRRFPTSQNCVRCVPYSKLDSEAGDIQHNSANVGNTTEHWSKSIQALTDGSDSPCGATDGKHPFHPEHGS